MRRPRAPLSATLVALVLVGFADASRGCAGDGDGARACDADLTAHFGWLRHESAMDGPCSIDRVRVTELTPRAFADTYKNRRPVVLTGMRDRNARFRRLCARDALLARWGDRRIVLSTANTHSYEKHVKTLREYAETHMAPQRLDVSGDATLYWFGDNNHTEWAAHFDEYVRPPFIPRSADVALSFGVGGPHSGVPLHIHGPGFSETVVGRKRWWLSPPRPKPEFDPNATALEWALGHLARWTDEGEGTPVDPAEEEDAGAGARSGRREDGRPSARMMACTVEEGEAVYFPDGWWHATLNLDESVFMSSFVNYREGGDDEDVDDGGASVRREDAFEL